MHWTAPDDKELSGLLPVKLLLIIVYKYTKSDNYSNVYQQVNGKTKLVYLYDGIPFSNKKRWTTKTCYNMGSFQIIMPSQRIQTEKSTYSMIPFTYHTRVCTLRYGKAYQLLYVSLRETKVSLKGSKGT